MIVEEGMLDAYRPMLFEAFGEILQDAGDALRHLVFTFKAERMIKFPKGDAACWGFLRLQDCHHVESLDLRVSLLGLRFRNPGDANWVSVGDTCLAFFANLPTASLRVLAISLDYFDERCELEVLDAALAVDARFPMLNEGIDIEDCSRSKLGRTTGTPPADPRSPLNNALNLWDLFSESPCV
ncbi:hypothetical protein BD414DRAFT_510851 [Trametes punicea]|nr:hypothetical protein BD414DRAFT_510851 [Trametes punicea]